MLMAPLAYPNTIFASATPRLRTRTRTRTFATSEYRSSGTRDSRWGIRDSRPGSIASGAPTNPKSRISNSSSEDPRGRHRPPAELDLADDVLLRHHAPVAAVGAVVAMVAHHEVIPFGNHLRAPVVV